MAILLSKNIAKCADRARPRGATTARRSVGLGLVEILSWMRHCCSVTYILDSLQVPCRRLLVHVAEGCYPARKENIFIGTEQLIRTNRDDKEMHDKSWKYHPCLFSQWYKQCLIWRNVTACNVTISEVEINI